MTTDTPTDAGSAPFDLDVTDRLLSTTRAVRKRLDLERPVEREVVLDCLRLAVQAPTGGNKQGWRWLVVTDPKRRAALAAVYRRAGADYLKRIARLAERGDGQQERVYDSAVHLAAVLHRVPVLVVPCVEGRPQDASTLANAGFYGSVLPAVWNFILALRSRGLGSVWTTLHLGREAEAAEILGIPDGVTQTALIPVAYTVGTDFRPAQRGPVEEITYLDRWGQTI